MLLLQKNNVSPKADVILGGKYDVDITEKNVFPKTDVIFLGKLWCCYYRKMMCLQNPVFFFRVKEDLYILYNV